MSAYSYQGRITGKDRINKFVEIVKELLENDDSLICEVNFAFAIPNQRRYEIELSTNKYENFITLRDYICFN